MAELHIEFRRTNSFLGKVLSSTTNNSMGCGLCSEKYGAMF